MEMERGLDPNANLARALSVILRRIHGVHTKGPTAVRRLHLAPKVERTRVSSDDTLACQCTLVGDSPNDEQRSDDLPSYQTTMFEDRDARGRKKKSTDLSLSKDG